MWHKGKCCMLGIRAVPGRPEPWENDTEVEMFSQNVKGSPKSSGNSVWEKSGGGQSQGAILTPTKTRRVDALFPIFH